MFHDTLFSNFTCSKISKFSIISLCRERNSGKEAFACIPSCSYKSLVILLTSGKGSLGQRWEGDQLLESKQPSVLLEWVIMGIYDLLKNIKDKISIIFLKDSLRVSHNFLNEWKANTP